MKMRSGRERTKTLASRGLGFCVALCVVQPSISSAHGAAPKKIEEKIDIAAKPEVVWGLIHDFAKISTWNPAVASSVPASDPDQGQERILTLAKGGKITDAQTDYDAKQMTYSYRRVDDDVKVFPVSFYSATITVTPTATGSGVDWIGRFYRGDTSNEPPPGLDDPDAIKAMTDFFDAGLKNLKTLAEKK
ncbi:MxaD protein [Methylovirgula ligni]|uniref:MxaD protein n=1 Tax=Methylovirgula ligni TaxID=569860 RepID=A0A3D9YW91_9HYPH|nr:SRPBCC family protein [Methylovirgula ligni]QAY96436.1 MxaD protein [Methylovirgula ligni]REF85833.1 mxaD protein [Methylovirgula ligni]